MKVKNFKLYLPAYLVFMSSAETLITGIEYKIRKLIGLNESLRAENKQLKTEAEGLRSEVEQLKLRINELQQQQITLKLAKTLNKEEKKTEVKLKINELVREIDHCIGLLNK